MKSISLFGLFLLEFAIKTCGLDIYLFYIDDEKHNLKDLYDEGYKKLLYLDDISYYGNQVSYDTQTISKLFPGDIYILIYGMLPQALETLNQRIIKFQINPSCALVENRPLCQNKINIYIHKIIVDRMFLLHKNLLFEYGVEYEIGAIPLLMTNIFKGNICQKWYYVPKVLPDLQTFNTNQKEYVDNEISEYNRLAQISKTQYKLFKFCTVNKFIFYYGTNPLVVTDYKVPDAFSLSPLYIGLIHPDLQAYTNRFNLGVETTPRKWPFANNYNNRWRVYPVWNNCVRHSNENFTQPWYKSIPTKNLVDLDNLFNNQGESSKKPRIEKQKEKKKKLMNAGNFICSWRKVDCFLFNYKTSFYLQVKKC